MSFSTTENKVDSMLILLIIVILIGALIWITMTRSSVAFYAIPPEDKDPILIALLERIHPIFVENSAVPFTKPIEILREKNILTEYKFRTSSTSFLLNDFNTIYIRVKNSNNEYYSTNQLTEVLLHELSHGISGDKQHTDKFYACYYALIVRAVDMKLYDPSLPSDPTYTEE